MGQVMEHRNGSRIQANLEADIFYRGDKLGSYAIRNIGTSGVCVENPANDLQVDNFLQVFIKPMKQPRQPIYKTSALVVWSTDKQAGLMWADQNLESSRFFNSLPAATSFHSARIDNDGRQATDRYGAEAAINGAMELETIQENPCKWCCTRKKCLVKKLEDQKVIALAKIVRQQKALHKGDRLTIQGDHFNSLFLVQSGSLKSSIIDNSGDCQITGFHFAGETLGMDGVESGRHLYEIEALETVSVCTVPFNFIETLPAANQGAFYRHLMGQVVGDAFKESNLLLMLGRMHAEQRLASFLLDIGKRLGVAAQTEPELKLSMTRHDIANYLGLAVETLSRLFRRFEENKLIDASRHRVRICNMAGLHDLVAGDHRFSGKRQLA